MQLHLILKYSTVVGLFATFFLGFKTTIPQTLNYETIRNVYFHVPMWFVMMILLTVGFVNSLLYLRTFNKKYDTLAYACSSVGVLFGIMGIATGMVWASAVWGSPWNNDPKQVGAAIALLGYFAYLVLRMSVKNEDLKSRVAAIYNIFAYFILFPTIWILPRMAQSLHPGGLSDSEVVFDPENLMPHMRIIMWLVALPSWFLLSWWLVRLHYRMLIIKQYIKNLNFK